MLDISQKTGLIYCRVSSKDQVDGTSLESQERFCKDYADRYGIKVLATFIETGESAKTIDRTEFAKAINLCVSKKGGVNYFIVHKVDRFTRNQYDYAVVLSKLRQYGTELRSATEPISETSFGKFIGGILSATAEFDNNIRTDRTTNGMLERIRAGVWQWQAPLGYYRPSKGSNIAPDPETAPIIKTIFEEYSKGTYTYKSLAEFASERGLKTKKGKKLFPQLIEKILKNHIYVGTIGMQGEVYEGKFEPIVSKELFNKCQKGYKSPHGAPRSINNPLFPLRGAVVCSQCLTPLTGSSSTGRMGKKYPYYHHHSQKCAKANFIPKETLEEKFVDNLESIKPKIKYEKLFRAIVLDIWKNNYKKLDGNNERVRKEISKLEDDRQRVFELHRAHKYTDEEFIAQKSLVNDEITRKYSMLGESRIEEFDMEEALSFCFDMINNASKNWMEYTYKDKVRFQKMIFEENIKFDGEKFGTTKLPIIYQLNKEYDGEKSNLVVPRRIELLFHP